MTIFKHGTISRYIKDYGRTRDEERGKTGGTEGQISKATGPQDDGRDKAGRSDTKSHRRSKTRRPVRRDNGVRPRGHRTTDAIRRAGAKRSHTDEQKTRRSVRRDKVVRPRGHRTTDAIRRAAATRSHTEDQKRDGRYGGTME